MSTKHASMIQNNFKWWYAAIGYVAYLLAMIINSFAAAASEDMFAPSSINTGAVFNLLMFLIAGILCLVFIRILSTTKISRFEFGLHLDGYIKAIGIGFLGGFLFFGLSEIIEANNETLREAGKQVMSEFNIGRHLGNDLLLILNICLFAPVVEEIIFRGAIFNSIFQGLKKFPKIPPWLSLVIAILISSYAFISIHGGGGQDAQFFLLGLLGIIAALSFYFTKSLFAAIFVHAINNAAVFIYAIYDQNDIASEYKLKLFAMALICLALCLPLGLALGRILLKNRLAHR